MKKGQTSKVVALLLVLVFLVALFLIIDTNRNKSSSLTGNVIKTLKNCRDVKIPYTVTEDYDYYPQARIMSSVSDSKLEMFGKGVYMEGTVLLKNIDNEATWFTISFNWQTLNDEWTDNVRHYVEPDETIEFVSIYDIDMGEDSKFSYTYKSEPVTKTRTVTKYRTEEKCD